MARRAKSTETPRADQLIQDCLQHAALLDRFREGGDDARARYRAELGAMAIPELERERGQLELAVRRRYTATPDNLLKASGPGVITMFLRGVGLRVFLRRVDLLDLAANGVAIPEPLTARVLEITESGGTPNDDLMAPKEQATTVNALRAIACTACCLPPDRYFEDADYDVDDIDPRECRPAFVMPGQRCGPGQLPVWVSEVEHRDDGWRGLRTSDLKEIAQAVVSNGPGAMLAFRLRQDARMAGLQHHGDDGRADQ